VIIISILARARQALRYRQLICFTDDFLNCRPSHSITGAWISTRIAALTLSTKKFL